VTDCYDYDDCDSAQHPTGSSLHTSYPSSSTRGEPQQSVSFLFSHLDVNIFPFPQVRNEQGLKSSSMEVIHKHAHTEAIC
jgi:hypothetical protein